MKILGIDSSTPQSASVALLENQRILTQINQRNGPPYSNGILPMVDRALSDAGVELSGVDGFAATAGPGSFTGLRVGAGLLKGLALGTGKPVAGIDTLEALAALTEPADYQICAILDAKKKEVYTAFFKYENGALARLTPDRVGPPEDLIDRISEPAAFIGSGLQTYGGMLEKKLGRLFIANPGAKDMSLAASAARLAYSRFKEKKSLDLGSLKIDYVRRPEAEINSERTNPREKEATNGNRCHIA
ncbi:MAG: tRNA (adenosine(37)-N6)-threonylcarbamoyltransferase complex dimerization subunit type 1 TsaB [Nitrospinae bacterium]|nr:tRNA (adenosine(37)-N6)-threonylcarbamoyltransferase complex dimerization subunit type 1 TsaB [Nitrospinota bacterium]